MAACRDKLPDSSCKLCQLDVAIVDVGDNLILRDFDISLAAHLVREWAWGQMSAVEVQILAGKAFEDESHVLAKLGAASEHGSQSLKMLAKLGSSGRHPGNAHRELINFVGTQEPPKCFGANVHVVVQKPRPNVTVVQKVLVPFLLPHVMFNYVLVQEPPGVVRRVISGEKSRRLLSAQTLLDGSVSKKRPEDLFSSSCTT